MNKSEIRQHQPNPRAAGSVSRMALELVDEVSMSDTAVALFLVHVLAVELGDAQRRIGELERRMGVQS